MIRQVGMSYFYKIRDKYTSKPQVSQPVTSNAQPMVKPIIETPKIQTQIKNDDETKDLERLKAQFIERRKRKKNDATNEG